jgi:hypothetical protein
MHGMEVVAHLPQGTAQAPTMARSSTATSGALATAMKLQIHDIDTWAVLAEASLTGKKFTMRENDCVFDEAISLPVKMKGTANREAFLISDDGTFMRVISLQLTVQTIYPGQIITILPGDLRWGRA